MEGLALVRESTKAFYLPAILLSLFALLGIVDLWGKKRHGDQIAKRDKKAVLVLVLMSEALWVVGTGNYILGVIFAGVVFVLAELLFPEHLVKEYPDEEAVPPISQEGV